MKSRSSGSHTGLSARRICGAVALTTMVVGFGALAAAERSSRSHSFWSRLYGYNAINRSDDPDRFHRDWRRRGVDSGAEQVRRWNGIAIDASGLDHTPPGPGEQRVFGEQMGPGRASLAIATVHIAIHDAVNAIEGKYGTYTRVRRAPGRASIDAAIAQAAHDALAAVFPAQRAIFDRELARDLAELADGSSKRDGIDTGRRAAAAILAMRDGDGSDQVDPRLGEGYIPGDAPGVWRQDPISELPRAVGADWGKVRPLVLRSSRQFRAPPPPRLNSAAYARAFNEVKRLGGDGVYTPTRRTRQQAFIGVFWAYDGTPSLCAPPRLYNQLAMTIADRMGTSRNVVELARLLALVNVAMSDAGIAIWESKFHYKFWRPVTGIREADRWTGPTGRGDGNPLTVADPTFTPLGAPASNLIGVDFTPPFPAYPSGHAGFGGAIFQILRRFYGTDRISFTFVSDEFNGETRGSDGLVRPRIPRTFKSLSQAEEENGQSRIYLGIHWSFDKTEGIAQGRKVANWVYDHAFRPERARR